MLRIPLALVLLLTACDGCTAPTLVAVVEEADSLSLQRLESGTWQSVRGLPSDARSVQLSPDGRSVAWIIDVTKDHHTTMQAWAWPDADDAPSLIGELGLREVDAPGLAVSNEGEVAWVDTKGVLRLWPGSETLGKGWAPVFGDDALAWIDGDSDCTRVRGLPIARTVCDPVAQVLDLEGGRLVARTQEEVSLLEAASALDVPLTEALRAAVSSGGRLAIVHRAREGRSPVDALSVTGPDGLEPVARHAIIVSVDWEDEETLLVVHKNKRADIYELMLAHAPAEFGGQSAAGTAVRVSLTGEMTPIAGLPVERVRVLQRVR